MLASIKAELTAAAKKVLPRWFLEYFKEYRRFPPEERALFRKLRVRQALGISDSTDRRAPEGARALLFLCYGNIMRSPMAAALLSEMLPGELRDRFQVVSAGLHASPDHAADPRSLRIAPDFGVRLDDHRSTQLTRQMVAEADAVFAMDRRNQVEFLALYPEAKEKLFMLGAYAEPKLAEIPDPYTGDEDDLRRCYRVLELCLRNLVRDLLREEPSGRQREGTVEAKP
jgi:protein-tyrosine phosphatase